MADVLVSADIRGINSHGLSRLKKYIDRINLGLISRESEIHITRQVHNTILIDANTSLGQVTAYESMKLAIKTAKEYGSSIVATGNANHFGIAARENLIGIVTTNTSPLMTPFGGKYGMLGTNPISVAIPVSKYNDIVIDMATSEAPIGKIEVAQREKQKNST